MDRRILIKFPFKQFVTLLHSCFVVGDPLMITCEGFRGLRPFAVYKTMKLRMMNSRISRTTLVLWEFHKLFSPTCASLVHLEASNNFQRLKKIFQLTKLAQLTHQTGYHVAVRNVVLSKCRWTNHDMRERRGRKSRSTRRCCWEIIVSKIICTRWGVRSSLTNRNFVHSETF